MVEQKHLEVALEAHKKMQSDLQKAAVDRQRLVSQQGENKLVLKEMELLDRDAVMFKQVGPVAIKQDVAEAKGNVEKRLGFIQQQIDSASKGIEGKQAEIQKHESQLAEMYEVFNKARQEAAGGASEEA